MSSPISRDATLRVLIVGGRPAAREALRTMLDAEADVAPRACAVEAAAAWIARWPPDVVVVDLDGIGRALDGLLIELRRRRPGAALILLELSEPGASSGGYPAQGARPSERGGLPWARLAIVLRSAVRSFGAAAGAAEGTVLGAAASAAGGAAGGAAERAADSMAIPTAPSEPAGAAAGAAAEETGPNGAPSMESPRAELAGPGGEPAEAAPSPPLATPDKSPTPDNRPRREPAGLRPGSVLHRLSPRELEVLRHLAQGLTVGQCARRLDLAHSTVDNHKARLMRKLGVHRTAELVRIALREGLIEP